MPLLAVPAALLASLGLALAADPSLDEIVESELGPLDALYRHLHRNPEISFQEEATAARIAAALTEAGIEVTTGFGDYEEPGRTCHAVVGVLRNGEGPTVLVRTDLDALPMPEETGLPYASRATTQDEAGNTVPVMHACGHDLHMACFVGSARALVRLRDRFRGTVVFVGQPAEERGAGARALLASGLYERFPRPDFALALHASPSLPAGEVGLCEGYALANVDSVDIVVRGRGGHGAYPQAAIDPIVAASQIVVSLQTIVSRNVSPFQPAVVTVGAFRAGTKHNIIPDEAHLMLTVRSYDPGVRDDLLAGIRRVARETGRAMGIPEGGVDVRVDETEFTPSTYNDPELTLRLHAVFEAALGEERVTRVDPVMAGEDFGRYSRGREIRATLFWLGTVERTTFEEAKRTGASLPPLHSPRFAPDPRPSIRTGVTAMTAAVLDLLAAD